MRLSNDSKMQKCPASDNVDQRGLFALGGCDDLIALVPDGNSCE
jgi:hypothetical protein